MTTIAMWLVLSCTSANALEVGDVEFKVIAPVPFCVERGPARTRSQTVTADTPFSPCPEVYVGMHPSGLPRRIRTDENLKEWTERITRKHAPRRLKLSQSGGEEKHYVLLARTEDTIIHPGIGTKNGTGHKLNQLSIYPERNAQFGATSAEYRFRYPERNAIPVRDLSGFVETSYLFLTDHACAGLTDASGTVTLKGIPLGVDIPLRVQIAWRSASEFTLVSDTLEFNKVGSFNVKLSHQGVTKHVIKVVPSAKNAKTNSLPQPTPKMDRRENEKRKSEKAQ